MENNIGERLVNVVEEISELEIVKSQILINLLSIKSGASIIK